MQNLLNVQIELATRFDNPFRRYIFHLIAARLPSIFEK
jgi:hypothetical protein